MNKDIDLKRIMSMAPRVKLGEVVEQTDVRNSDDAYKIDDVRGISINKILIPTKADMNGVSLKLYKVLYSNEFGAVTVTSRNGEKISLAMNQDEKAYILSSTYLTFRVKDKNVLCPNFLFLLLNRDEFDRYSRFNSWGSARETFDWSEMERVEIPLPSIEVQREIVSVYEGLRQTAEQNEAMFEPLAKACHAYIVDCKEKYPSVRLGEYVTISEKVNRENNDYNFIGININKEFMPTSATTKDLDKKKYKVIEKGKFVFSGMQTGRDVAIRIGLYNEEKPSLISPAYTIFSISEDKKEEILPEFLNMQFARKESDRLGWFYSDSSVRSNLDWERFCDIQIPLPPIEVQEAIVALHRCAEEAKAIANEARELMKTICPALVQKAAHSL